MVSRRARRTFFERLAHEIEGDVAADLFARGRYATDASIHQCFPAGVACPKSEGDVAIIVEMAREEGLPVTARGGGTSTAGQALGEGIIVDFSKYLRRVLTVDVDGLSATVEAGCTAAALNDAVEPSGLTLGIDILSARQATIGGMVGNNARGLRGLRYGSMRERIAAADAYLADGQKLKFKEVAQTGRGAPASADDRLLDLLQFGELHEKEIATLWPLSAPGVPEAEAYDLRALLASEQNQNLARLLAGAEGTLALATKIELRLAPRPKHTALGIGRFASLAAALRVVPKITLLDPCAIELLDGAALRPLAGSAYDALVNRMLQGEPQTLLVVEFDRDNPVENTRLLKALDGYAADGGKNAFSLIEIVGERAQESLWQLRRLALQALWTAKAAARPLPFMDDAAVPIHRLEEYGAKLEALFARWGAAPLLYGHVGQGCLGLHPVLNLGRAQDRARMHALAQGMAELVGECGGVLTLGHGLGLSRSEALERKLGTRAMTLLAQFKAHLDPANLFNPGKILRAPPFDEPLMLRAPYETAKSQAAALSWDAGSGAAFEHVHACTGLSLCRRVEPPFACPSYAATRDERDSPRGRANSLRLALSGQLGEGALSSDAMLDTMALCVSCKACRVTCPAAIDIPKLKVEALAAARDRATPRAEELYARLPEYADKARRWRALIQLRDLVPGLARLSQASLGFAADRPLPRWSGRRFRPPRKTAAGANAVVALFADTFNRCFEPANLRAAASVLSAAGYGVMAFADGEDGRALCCGRTYYDTGKVEEARREAKRMAAAVSAFAARNIPVIGLEPACVLMLRDEYAALGVPVPDAAPMLLFEEFAAAMRARGAFSPPLKPIEAETVLHSHCHERALGIEGAAEAALALVPGLAVIPAPATCCGLNGVVGMTPDTFEASLAMAEQALFPAIRKAGRDAFIAATGFSCRKQVHDGLGRAARHPALLLELALKGDVEIVR